jgi:ferredoxin
MSRPVWFVELIKKAFAGRYLAARATRLPAVGKMVDRWLFDGDDLIYLPRDRSIPVHTRVDLPGEMVLPSQVVEYFVERASHHWIMDTCLCRDAGDCQDYPVGLGCLFLGQAVMDINPRLGRLVTKQEALAHVRRCREAGLVHLIGRNKLDTLWLGVGPGRRLLTICHCCPCCCLWRVLPHVAPAISAKVVRMPGVDVTVTDRCVGCGACTRGVCFVDAIRLVNGRAGVEDQCRGCGRCVGVCPQEAIEITLQQDGFLSETVARIANLVDVS